MRHARPVFTWLTALLVPAALIFLAVRILLTNAFLQVEYRLPGFPEDPYGFTLEDRLHYAPLALGYLLDDSGIESLGSLTFPDGSPLFNARELSHMEDVRAVVRPVLWTGYGIWLFLLAAGLWARRGGWWMEYLAGLGRGGWIAFGLATVVALSAAVSFMGFFTVFHALFFEGDSWLFFYSDTLIRLFPVRFWQDAVIFLLAVSGGMGLLLGLTLGPKRRPNAG